MSDVVELVIHLNSYKHAAWNNYNVRKHIQVTQALTVMELSENVSV